MVKSTDRAGSLVATVTKRDCTPKAAKNGVYARKNANRCAVLWL